MCNQIFPENDAEIFKMVRTRAEANNAKAQCDLGAMLEDGRGVTKDEAGAVAWYRKAAEQGHAGAQCNLGIMLKHHWQG